MVRGIIYMYTSPSGKSYIGQTTDEKRRRRNWFSSLYEYAGAAINRARAKYGKDSFTYTVLFSHVFSTKKEAAEVLNIMERYYIKVYDTFKHGYNCDEGGKNNAGYILSKEARKNIGNGGKLWMNTPEGKEKLSKAHKGKHKKSGYRVDSKFIPIVKLTLDGQFVKEYPSITDATLNKNERVNISGVCKGKRDSVAGYKWLYKDDYWMYFLHPESPNIPQAVQRALDDIKKRTTPKIKKKYKHKPVPKKTGPRINTHARQVGQYDENYNLIKVWRCATEASKQLGIWQSNISRAIRTKGMYMGTYWRNYNGEQRCEPKLKKKREHAPNRKPIIQKTLEGDVVCVHESISAASKSLGKSSNVLINKALHGRAKGAYGYVWEYLNCA